MLSLRQVVDTYLSAEATGTQLAQNVPLIRAALDVVSLSTTISEQTGEKDNKQLGVWTNRVNGCLQSGDPAIRWVGLTLLLETTARCDPDTFATNCSVWTGAAAKVIDSDRGPSAVLAMECMRKTLSFSCRDPELRRDHAKYHLPTIVNSLLALASAGGETAAATAAAATATDAARRTAFVTLGACARDYPGPTRPFAGRMRKATLAAIDCPASAVGRAAATCFAMIPASASASAKSQGEVPPWQTTCLGLLGTAHQLVAWMYKGAEEEPIWDSINITYKPLVINEIVEGDLVVTMDATLRRLKMVLLALRELIGTKYSTCVSLPIDGIMGLVCRILGTDRNLLKSTRAHSLLSGVLPTLYMEALLTFESLIVVAKQHLLSQQDVVLQVITQSLRRRGLPGPLRQLTYVLTEKVVRNLGPMIEPKILQDIIDAILLDCQAKTACLGGTEGTAAQRQYAVSRLRDIDRDLVCAGALEALAAIMLVCSRDLTPRSQEQVTAFLLKTLTATGASEPDHFRDAGCRLKLYRVFRASILVASATQATCVPHAVIIFGNGLQDASDEIRYFCIETGAMLDQLIHPIVGSLPRRSQFVRESPVSGTDAAAAAAPSAALTAAAADVEATLAPQPTHASAEPVAAAAPPLSSQPAAASANTASASVETVSVAIIPATTFHAMAPATAQQLAVAPAVASSAVSATRSQKRRMEEDAPVEAKAVSAAKMARTESAAETVEAPVLPKHVIVPVSADQLEGDSDDDMEMPEILDEAPDPDDDT